MNSKAGKRTEEFGLWLTQFLCMSEQYSVFYDHGDKKKNRSVAAIKGFLGDKLKNSNRLTDVDALVTKDDEVVLLIEIEENELSPKKLLGDIFASLLSDRFAVRINNKNTYFDISSKTQLMVAGVMQNQRYEPNKFTDTLKSRLQGFNMPVDAIQIDRISIVTGKDVSETLEKLKSEIKKVLALG